MAVVALVAVGVAVASVIGVVLLRPFAEWRPGSTHAGQLYVDGCGVFDPGIGDAKPVDVSDRSKFPWVVVATGTIAPRSSGAAPLTMNGTLTVTDDQRGVFTADDGQQFAMQRGGFCPASYDG